LAAVAKGGGLSVKAEAAQANVSARPRSRRILGGSDLAIRLASVLVVLGTWEFLGPSLNPGILKPPSAILAAFPVLIQNGELQLALGQSLRVYVLGMAIALVVGLVLGIASGRARVLYNVIDPWVSALYSIPAVALIPVIGVALGYTGDLPRIATVALFGVFPILINTQQGVRNVDPGLLEVARAFSSSERRLWKDVVVPSALPFILAGVRLAIGRGLIGMIVAEFLIGLAGLGYLIIVYQNTFRIDRMFVPVIVVAVIGIALMGFVQFIEGRVAPWLRREQQ